MWIFVIAFIAPFLAGRILAPLSKSISERWRFIARPGGRRQHREPIARLGGLAILGPYLLGIVIIYMLMPPVGDDALRLRGVLIGTLIVFLGGLVDDRWELSPWVQFLVQIVGAFVAIGHIVFIEVFTNPISGNEVHIPWDPVIVLVTLIWIVGIINTINWLDGLDGLAVGVGTIAAVLFAWHGIRLGQESVAAFPLALAGALLGFLPLNFAPARIFLGTAGAYLLGYNLATLAILSPAKIATALLVLAVPLVDGLWRIIDRLRQGRSPFYGDRGHLHFLLLDQGIGVRKIVVGYYLLSLIFGLVAIFATGLFKLIVLAFLGVGILITLVSLSFQR